MRICVTGSCGYLGTILCEELLADGHSVVAIDDLRYNQTSLLHLLSNKNLEFYRLDCCDEKIYELAKGCNFIIPLAAIVGAPACDRYPEEARRENSAGVEHAILAASVARAGILVPNTNSGFGNAGDRICTEDTPLNPISLYGTTKQQAEISTLKAGGVVFRFATLMGVSPRMRFDLLVNDFTGRAYRDRYLVVFEGSFRRNYLHVRDAALVFIWAMKHYDDMKGLPYNVGLPDVNLTKLELCEAIKKHLPDFYFCEAPIGSDPDKRSYIISNERILRTGWRPKYSLDDAITELIRAMPMFKQPWMNV